MTTTLHTRSRSTHSTTYSVLRSLLTDRRGIGRPFEDSERMVFRFHILGDHMLRVVFNKQTRTFTAMVEGQPRRSYDASGNVVYISTPLLETITLLKPSRVLHVLDTLSAHI